MSFRNSLTRHNYSPSGFQQIPENQTGPNSGDVSIPMEPVRSVSNKTSGSRRAGDRSPALPNMQASGGYNEKGPAPRPGNLLRHNTTVSGDGKMTTMGKIYDKIKNFSIITRYLLYVLPVSLVLLVPIIILATPLGTWTPDPKDRSKDEFIRWGGVRAIWIWVWVEIFWCSLWGAKLAAKSFPAVFQFLCGIVSPGVRKYKSVLKRLEIPISVAIWLAIDILTFDTIIVIDAVVPNDDKNVTTQAGENGYKKATKFTDISWASTFSKVLLAFLISSLVFFGEQFIIQLISISYHHTQYEEKIRASKHNIDIITLLYEASTSLFPAYCPEFAEEDYIINDSLELPKGIPIAGSRPKSGAATPLRLIQNVGRFGDKVTTVFGNIASEVTGKQVFNPMASHSIIVEALEKRRSCEALARRIWMSLVVEGRDALYLDDVQEVLAGHGNWNAEDVFSVLDKDGNGDVSLDEMILTVTEFGRERKAIASSLHDVDQAIKVLDRLLLFLVLLICVFVFILVLSPSTTTSLTGIGTSLLSLSFVFAVTTQEILGSCIFLFVKHPYDVGDRVDITTQQLIVERISLLYTVFKCVNTGKMTQTPNIVLNTLWIENVSRSGAMKEQLLMNIDFSTTIEDIELLRTEMLQFVNDKDNSRDFQSDVIVEVTGVNNMDKMELKVEIRHKSNWHNETLRAARRSKFMCALVLALRKVPINPPGGSDAGLGSADQPSWSVAISPEDAKAARQAFKDGKEAKKLSNQNKDGGSSSGADPNFLSPESSLRSRKDGNGGNGGQGGLASASESSAMNILNARSLTYNEFESGNEQAGLSPGRPAVDSSKSPVRADSQRTRELNALYSELTKSPSSGKRRQNYNVNVTGASPTQERMPSTRQHDVLAPSEDSSLHEDHFSGEQSPGARPRSGSPSGRAYSPLGRDTFERDGFFHQDTNWGTGTFMTQQSPSPPGAARVPPPPQTKYVTPPAKADDPPKVSSPGESWLDRDSALYPSGGMDHIASGTIETSAPPRGSRGPPSARASSVALGSLPESGGNSPAVPSEPMPKSQMHSSTAKNGSRSASQKGVSRGQSTKSDASWGRGDETHFA